MPIRLDQLEQGQSPTGALRAPRGLQLAGVTLGKTPSVRFAVPPSSSSKVEEAIAKKQAEEQQNLQELQTNLSTIKETLKQIPQTIPPDVPFGNQANTLLNYGRGALQALDPRFRDATSAVQATVGKFMQTIEKLPRGRLTQGEIFKLSSALGDLPYLSDADREKRFAIIDQLAGKAGVQAASTPSKGFKYLGVVH